MFSYKNGLVVLGLTALLLTGCQDDKTGDAQASQEQSAAPVEVQSVTIKHEPVFLQDELPGRVVAFRTAEIRPQVGGIVLGRSFEQGSEVEKGATLFEINPATFKADADTAAASLKRAEALLLAERTKVKRLKPLVEADAISKQSYDDAIAAEAQALADVAQAKATYQRRKLDLEFATVTSPITGRIDQTFITEGALVAPADANPMAVVQQIDQVYVDVRQPAARLEMLREVAADFDQKTPIAIISSTGKELSNKGELLFSGINVDAGTGDTIVRVLVPNEDRSLLPGMYVRAKLPRSMMENGILVPQQAIHRDAAGGAFVHVVKDSEVSDQPVKTGEIVGGKYVILSGLEVGQVIITAGADRLQPGMKVKAVENTVDHTEKTEKETAPESAPEATPVEEEASAPIAPVTPVDPAVAPTDQE